METDIVFDSSKYFAGWGEMLLRLSPPHCEKMFQSPMLNTYFGGAECNCAVLLSQLGLKTKMITVLPDTFLGIAAKRYLRSFNINVDSIVLDKNGRMGLYFYEKGIGVRASKLLYDRKGSSFSLVQEGSLHWDEIVKDCGWFHTTGITLALSPAIIRETIKAFETVKKYNGIISFDINYRTTLWGNETLAKKAINECIEHVDVLIGNKEHITQLIVSEQIIDSSKIIEDVYAKFPGLKVLLITTREGRDSSHTTIGAIAASKHTQSIYKTKTLDSIVDRIGAGDALAAGFIYSIIHKMELNDAVEFALSLGSLAHYVNGDNFIVEKNDIDAIVTNKSSRLIR